MSKFAHLFKGAAATDDTDNPPAAGEKEEAPDPESYTLLFVDDEANVLRALERIFFEESYNILTASCGENALSVMESHHVQLVISDFVMPGMTGAELLRAIKNRWPETIRIMLTGYADIQAIMGAVNEGAVYKFITKPWNDDDLRLTVSLALQQYELVRENKKLKDIAKTQRERLADYSRLFDEYRGVLGSVLTMEGVVSEEQLRKASKQVMRDETLGETLVRLGFTTEGKIARAIQKNQNLGSVSLREVMANPNVAKLFPREFCLKNRMVAVKLEGKTLTIAMADPTDIIKIDNISMLTGFRVTPVVALLSEIMEQISVVYPQTRKVEERHEPVPVGEDLDDFDEMADFEPMEEIDIIIDEEGGGANVQDLISSSGVPPIVRIVNATILEALRYQASDVHIEPKTKYSIVRYRIDGMLHTKIKVPLHLHGSVVSRIKILAKMDIAERRKPQDGRITIKTGTRVVDVRVSTMPTVNGEKVVMRILDKNASIRKLPDLGMSGEDLRKIEMIVKKPQGILISTGPTGSGKTTLLYSVLHKMLTSTKNFETIEDPVEYFLEGASQVHVKESIGLSFDSVLRATLRQDPDVLLVGEVRDFETADVALKAALTGHMVLTTLHTNNAVTTITRLIDLGVQPYLVASSLEGIVAQRLARRVCPYCKTGRPPGREELDLLMIPEGTLNEVTVGGGCYRCNNTGYQGRIGIFEVLIMNDGIRQVITGGCKESEVFNLARASGMRTLMEDGLEKVRAGVTTLEEILRVIGPPVRYERACERCGKNVDIKFLYCPFCGHFKENICHTCRMTLEAEWRVCPYCGSPRIDNNLTD